MRLLLLSLGLALFPSAAWAAEGQALNLTQSGVGFAALAIFAIAYVMVMGEEKLHLKKSIPVMVAAGLIWVLVAWAFGQLGNTHGAEEAVRHNILEFGELFLFLLAAMTFINTMEDRGVFNALRAWLVGRGFSLRTLFWVTGILAFVMSPIADNLTTALVMGAVVMAVGAGKPAFVAIACINIVVAANAGGAFSPFGDITTLMVWQKGIISFQGFFPLFLPSLINWLIPAAIMSLAIETGQPEPMKEKAEIQPGGLVVIGLFIVTIALAVCFHNFLHLPPVLGMMTGLGILKFYSFSKSKGPHREDLNEPDDVFAAPTIEESGHGRVAVETLAVPAPVATLEVTPRRLDVFKQMERAEWDTLMFFYGVILCVGGLGTLGYLGLASTFMYGELGATTANVLVGVLSAIVDNIPVMFAVLSMNPDMGTGQWLLVTLTAGVGGSLLSVGSAAGVALMGQARGVYTFLTHLKWSWAIALGYAASIGAHLLLNRHLF